MWDIYIYLHLQFQEEDEEDEDMDGSEDGTASPTASEDEQQEGNVHKWYKNTYLVDVPLAELRMLVSLCVHSSIGLPP